MRVFFYKTFDCPVNKYRPYKDFGQGFYCTEIKEQAELMTKIVARIYGGTLLVNKFELDENIYNSNKLNFDKLIDIETGLYKEGSSYIYELLIDELNEGLLIQKEQ